MEPEELYLMAAREAAELSYEWATQAKRAAQSINAWTICLFTFGVNFLVTLTLITLTR
jgi:hypothetical protein